MIILWSASTKFVQFYASFVSYINSCKLYCNLDFFDENNI